MTPLEQLAAAKAALDVDEARSFDDYLLGALSASVPADVWAACLETAARCTEDARERRRSQP